MKQDYAKIRRAGAELIVLSPDCREAHEAYAAALFGQPLPYLFVPDPSLDIARRYGLLREEEHPHGGFWYRSLWILDGDGRVTHKRLPWTANKDIDEYQWLFALIGSEPGEWIAMCGLAESHGA